MSRATIEDLRTAALFYAWGQQDAGVGREVDAWAFSQRYQRLAEQYAQGVTCFRPSIQDAWHSYQVEGEK